AEQDVAALSGRDRAFADGQLAGAYARAGRFARARQLLEAMARSNGVDDAGSLPAMAVARELAEAGRFDEALALAPGIRSAFLRVTSLIGVASAALRAGQAAAADRAFAAAREAALQGGALPGGRAVLLASIAAELLAAGRRDAAQALFD